MRLEQLVLFGPSDNFTVSFGPRVTVLAGLTEAERAGMLQTLVEAMAGKVPNASVIFVDQAGRRVFADRMGATYAETGVAAPSLGELLGTDPAVIADLVTLRAEDLGLGAHRDEADVQAELASAQAAHEQLLAEHTEATGYLIELEAWQRELDELDALIDRATDDAARWAWMGLRAQLDQLKAELAALDAAERESDEEADDRLIEAVEQLRSAGEAWAEASTAAAELASELGPLPPVSDADLARVAATPEHLPDDFDDRIEAVADAVEVRAACEAQLARLSDEAEDPGDGIVYELARIEQDRLWSTYDAAVAAQEAYDRELAERQDDGEEHPAEGPIEDAHREVVRCQREVERRFRPGALAVGALAVTALLAGDAVSLILGVLLLWAAVGIGWWLLVVPRRVLAEAEAAERAALEQTEADSWLGLHLRRIDQVVNRTDRAPLSAALDRRTSTLLDWEECSGGVSLGAAGERREAIIAHATDIDPQARAARDLVARQAVAEAADAELAARAALGRDLEGYGLSVEGAADLDADQIRRVLLKRTAAGRVARQALELQHQLATATSTGAILDRLLRDLGFDDGDLAGRLERAIVAVEAAHERRAVAEPGTPRRRDQLEYEIRTLTAEVEAGRRVTWDLTPDPTEAPVERDDLLERRRALGLQVVSTPKPDLVAIERRLGVTAERIRTLETEIAELAEGSGSVRRRLADRIARTTWIGPNEETLPIVIDDAFLEAEPEELFKLLEMLVRLSSSTQIVLLSTDATVAKWARREAADGVVTVFESHGAEVR